MDPARGTLKLFVGLGNPGREYATTRHNAGFWLLDRVARARGVTLAREARFAALVARVGSECWLLEPQTFMNRSGQSVGALARFYRIAPEEILVAHDELDLQPGDIRMKRGGGHAGHNGLKDIVGALGSADFWRLRIGIGHPRNGPNPDLQVVDYVLHRPSVDDQAGIDAAIGRALDVWPLLERGELERAMHQLHTRPKPAGKEPEEP